MSNVGQAGTTYVITQLLNKDNFMHVTWHLEIDWNRSKTKMKAIKYHLSKMASWREKQQYENKHEPNQQRIFHVRTKDQDEILQESNNIILQKATTPSLMIEDFSDYEVDRISNKAMEIFIYLKLHQKSKVTRHTWSDYFKALEFCFAFVLVVFAMFEIIDLFTFGSLHFLL